MKIALWTFFFCMLGFGLSAIVGNEIEERHHDTLNEQSARLSQELWKLQGQFDLQQHSVKLEVRREKDMEKCGCWGMGHFGDDGNYYIAIQAMEDMPQSMPWAYRRKFQNSVLQHEVIHIALTQAEVPPPFQDQIIRRLQPSLREP